MDETSTNLHLPYLQAAQSQKHITHNEAIERLDLIVQLVVQGFAATLPPLAPQEGQIWALGSGAVNDWAGQDGTLAAWSNGGWLFIAPRQGWRAAQGADLRVWNGTDWVVPDLPALQNLPGVGVNTGYDAFNRLSVAAPASLFSHDGGGHQVKINKAGPGETASLLMQSGWSGRAEMGLAGSDDFAVKVSDDGTTWRTALSLIAASGRARFGHPVELDAGSAAAPSLAVTGDTDTGLFAAAADVLAIATGGAERVRVTTAGISVEGAVTGSAVTQSARDLTAGRLLKTGDFGIGGAAVELTGDDDLDGLDGSGFYFNPFAANAIDNNYPVLVAGALLNLRRSAANWSQLYVTYGSTPAATRLFLRSQGGSGWSPWVEAYHQGSVLGPVSQSGGVPAGKLIERGSNGNGHYMRLADGTQICWRAGAATSCTSAHGSVFMSTALQGWTYPAAFAAEPCVSGGASGTTRWLGIGAPGTTSVNYRVFTTHSDSTQLSPLLVAIGSWY